MATAAQELQRFGDEMGRAGVLPAVWQQRLQALRAEGVDYPAAFSRVRSEVPILRPNPPDAITGLPSRIKFGTDVERINTLGDGWCFYRAWLQSQGVAAPSVYECWMVAARLRAIMRSAAPRDLEETKEGPADAKVWVSQKVADADYSGPRFTRGVVTFVATTNVEEYVRWHAELRELGDPSAGPMVWPSVDSIGTYINLLRPGVGVQFYVHTADRDVTDDVRDNYLFHQTRADRPQGRFDKYVLIEHDSGNHFNGLRVLPSASAALQDKAAGLPPLDRSSYIEQSAVDEIELTIVTNESDDPETNAFLFRMRTSTPDRQLELAADLLLEAAQAFTPVTLYEYELPLGEAVVLTQTAPPADSMGWRRVTGTLQSLLSRFRNLFRVSAGEQTAYVGAPTVSGPEIVQSAPVAPVLRDLLGGEPQTTIPVSRSTILGDIMGSVGKSIKTIGSRVVKAAGRSLDAVGSSVAKVAHPSTNRQPAPTPRPPRRPLPDSVRTDLDRLKQPPQRVAWVFVVRGPDEVLVHKRADGTVGIPGGNVEAGETPVAAAVRELHEEAGLTVSTDTLRQFHAATVGTKPMSFFVYRGDVTAPVPGPIAGHEGELIAWADPMGEDAGGRHRWISVDSASGQSPILTASVIAALKKVLAPPPPVESIQEGLPAWAQGLFSAEDVAAAQKQECTGTFVGPECGAASVLRDLQVANAYKEIGSAAHSDKLADYNKKAARIATLKAQGDGLSEEEHQELVRLEKEMAAAYPDHMLSVHVPGTTIIRQIPVINPFKASAYRRDPKVSFANPAGASRYDPEGKMAAANTAALSAVVPTELRRTLTNDKAMTTALLESLWYCGTAYGLNDRPECNPAKVLAELREYAATRDAGARQAMAKDLLKSSAWSTMSQWLHGFLLAQPGRPVYPYVGPEAPEETPETPEAEDDTATPEAEEGTEAPTPTPTPTPTPPSDGLEAARVEARAAVAARTEAVVAGIPGTRVARLGKVADQLKGLTTGGFGTAAAAPASS